MGICASCLGVNRRDSPEVSDIPQPSFGASVAGKLSANGRSCLQPESSRLLEEDNYPAGYSYGSLNNTNEANPPDTEYVKREREALEAICQRASESVIDIWSIQPQPHLQPRATLRGPVSPSSSRPGTDDGAHVVIASASDDVDSTHQSNAAKDGAVPKHWGEVVINPRKGKKPQQKLNTTEENGRDFFGVLKVT
ncbi:hypothetical protein FE257_006102 [Aspergillus nanangensis]|uniref:Late endosomal/lysosomal adaptor and MAPK and MTOR activator-domain-containing protein n=1 Tax=Aspergillus nanangensis TaxID=2582783 RepID=A0AAD4CPB2_ASPNN|nr:hypothetical protein FE257_006102 [Aspergillus nanangensis]